MKTSPIFKLLMTALIAFSAFSCGKTPPPAANDALISGTVTDKSTGKPIGNATVTLVLSGNSTPMKTFVTEQDGKYTFKELPHSLFMVFAEADGYLKESTKANMVQITKATVNFSLNSKGTSPVTEVPVLQTVDASYIGYNSAYAGGVLVSTNNGNITEWGICYSTSPKPTIQNEKATAVVAGTSFETKLLNLSMGTKYYIRAYATNEIGTGYGEEKEFFTLTSAYDRIYIPDKNFLQALLDAGYDINNDGFMGKTEADKVTALNVKDKMISSLEGIEYFINLKSLDCSNNNISSLDISGLAKLEELKTNHNPTLASLVMTGCTALSTLECNSTSVSSLELAAPARLKKLSATETAFEVLDLSGCTELTELYCSNSKLISITANGLTKLKIMDISGNSQISTLDVSGNSAMTDLNCSKCGLSSIYLEGCEALVNLNVEFNTLSSLDVSYCPKLEELYIDGSYLSDINLSTNTALRIFSCKNNDYIAALDLSNSNPVSVDLTGCSSLTSVYVSPTMFAKINNAGEIAGWIKPASTNYLEL